MNKTSYFLHCELEYINDDSCHGEYNHIYYDYHELRRDIVIFSKNYLITKLEVKKIES